MSKYIGGAIVVFDLHTQQVKWSQHLDLTTDSTQFRAYIYSAPTVVDLDGDGFLEIIVGTSVGFIYCLDAFGQMVAAPRSHHRQHAIPRLHLLRSYCRGPRWRWVPGDHCGHRGVGWLRQQQQQQQHLDLTTDSTQFRAYIYSAPTVVDLDGDGFLEIIVGTSVGFICLDAFARLTLFPLTLSRPYSSSTPLPPTTTRQGEARLPLADGGGALAGGGSRREPRRQARDHCSRHSRQRGRLHLPLLLLISPPILRFLPVPSPLQPDSSYLYLSLSPLYSPRPPPLLLPTPGKVKPGFPLQMGEVQGQVVAADVNHDGKLEIIAADTRGNVAAFSSEGKEVWERHLASLIAQGASVGDVNGDGFTEVVIGSSSGHIYVLDGRTGEFGSRGRLGETAFGAEAEEVWERHLALLIAQGMSVGDVNGDGFTEVVIGSSSGHIYVLDGRTGENSRLG
ncbi:unnamed protein product [Closterium sp. NIES-54]